MSNPFDALNEEQKTRLGTLQSSIQYDRLTVSFSIEGRLNEFKKSAFYSVTISKNDDGVSSKGWDQEEVSLVRLMLCKHVVRATYEDAVRRGVLDKTNAVAEVSQILASYDGAIVKAALQGGENK
jgi:hypothetical protein